MVWPEEKMEGLLYDTSGIIKSFGKEAGIILPMLDRTRAQWLKLLEENCGWDVRKNLYGKTGKAFDKSN